MTYDTPVAFGAPTWHKNYKIAHQMKCILGPGGTCIYKTSTVYNWLFSTQDFYGVGETIGNKTTFIMIVQQGAQATNDSTDKSQVSICSTSLNIVRQNVFKYCSLPVAVSTYGIVTPISTMVAAFTNAENVMNQDTANAEAKETA